MASEWSHRKIGEVVACNTDTYSPKEEWDFVNYLDTGNITEGTIDSIQRITDHESLPSRARRKVQPGDIVYSTVRPNQNHYGIIKDPLPNMLVSTGFAVIRGIHGECDTRFLYYFLTQRPIVDYLHSVGENSTSAYPSIKPSDIESLDIYLPPLPIQRRIADVLGKLDDKIELNRRMNRTLEKMAAAIFKSWFIDFDPVHAKAEGRDTNLPAEIANLFPDRLEDSDLGPIPKGWTLSTLGALCEKPQYGYTASASDTPIGPHFLRITDINKQPWIEWETVPFCGVEEENAAKYLLKPGDIVIARMADPGHAALIEEEQHAVFASYLIRFRPLTPVLDRYLQYWLRSASYWDLIHGRKTGSTRATLNAKVLSELPLIRPPDDVVAAFRQQVTRLRNRVVHNVRHSASLAGLRDTLLPKLLSGEIDPGSLPEAEVAAEEVP